jgi:AhpD family alkylhydroperoxidase
VRGLVPHPVVHGIPYAPTMTEHQHGRAVLDDLIPLGRNLREAIPEVYAGYGELGKAAMGDGALSSRTKELIALAVSVALRCDGCIASHARNASKTGATREEAAEALGVAIMLTGGPGTVYGPRAYDAFCEFADARDARSKQAAAETGVES